MAKLDINPENFKNLPPSSDEVLPAGDYKMQVVQSELRSTKAGDGQYLWLEFEILGPNFAGRRFWDRLNLFNKNEQAVKIANQQLMAISNAVGMSFPPGDSEELHFKPIKVVIKHKDNKQGNVEARPHYYGLGTNTASSAPVRAVTPAAEHAAPAAKPWERHKK